MKKLIILIVVLGMLISIVACSKEKGEELTMSDQELVFNNPHAVITMEDGGIMKLKLHKDVAPISVDNFIKLALDGFYDGLIYHRVIANFMIQGGDPTGTGMGGPGHNIKGEFSQNGVINNISHVRGTLSMARSQDFNSAGSQFFIVHQDSTFLDGAYAAFGTLVEGFEVLDKIATTPTNAQDRPMTEQIIKSIVIIDEP